MSKAADPYYNRKSVPDDFIEHVGYTGLQPSEESTNRERKLSTQGGDLRKFWNPKTKEGKLDPYYQRKQVPDALTHGVGETGLTPEEEYLNRERKYSVGGSDVRRFGSNSGGFHPTDDPYYGRKAVKQPQIAGVGETGYSKAEEFETRENKAALFDMSSDPFQQLTGRGHRGSIAAGAASGAAEARRRSSAVAPDHMGAARQATAAHYHSGYDGDQNRLAPIPSRQDDDIQPSADSLNNGVGPSNGLSGTTGTTTTTTTTTTTSTGIAGDGTGHHVGDTGHTIFYDQATKDLNNPAPHERV